MADTENKWNDDDDFDSDEDGDFGLDSGAHTKKKEEKPPT